MSEKGKGSMLLPLGIGAGLLILLTSMKKKEAAPVTAATPDDAAALLPQVSSEEAAVPQINPVPAPTYAQAQAKTAPEERDEEGGEEEIETPDPQQSEEDPETENADGEDEDDSSYSSSSGSRSGGGGSYTPYRPSSTINTNRQATPLPASGQQLPAVNAQTRLAVNPKSIRFQSDQAKMAALQKARNNKGLRFQSDQAKKFAQRSGANPLYIGNGKPRAGVSLPVNYRPGATAAVQQPIAITSQQAALTPATTAVKQTTIFPLRFGTTSSYVKEVQRRLGVSATGYFGTLTRTAIQKRFRVSEISEALYKQIITGKAPMAQPIRKPAAKVVRKIRKPLPKKINVIRRK